MTVLLMKSQCCRLCAASAFCPFRLQDKGYGIAIDFNYTHQYSICSQETVMLPDMAQKKPLPDGNAIA